MSGLLLPFFHQGDRQDGAASGEAHGAISPDNAICGGDEAEK